MCVYPRSHSVLAKFVEHIEGLDIPCAIFSSVLRESAVAPVVAAGIPQMPFDWKSVATEFANDLDKGVEPFVIKGKLRVGVRMLVGDIKSNAGCNSGCKSRILIAAKCLTANAFRISDTGLQIQCGD